MPAIDSHLTIVNSLLLFGTALVAGGLNAVAGGGSFITFPMLMFAGMTPIVANATNNTALWVASLASASAYRKDLGVERRVLTMMCGVSLMGGTIGSIALLYTAPDVFERSIPYLLLFAALVFTCGDAIKASLVRSHRSTIDMPPSLFKLAIVQLAISIYGGFFGAGMGILMLATLTFLGIKNINSSNALKALLGSCINGIAIVPFLFAGIIAWQQVIIMAIGGAIGGYYIARFARQIPPVIIRTFVSIVAFGMSAYFFAITK
jgi:uncharacterized protein